MALKLSKALRNEVLGFGSWKTALTGGRILVYTGSAPANAEDAVTGTLLGTFTDNSGAYTAEVRSTSTVTLTGGASGSVNSLTLFGADLLGGVAVPFNASLTQTAADVAAQINRAQALYRVMATSSGAVITLTSNYGIGASFNTALPVCGTTTITSSVVAFAGGVSVVNGLRLSTPSAGILQKDPTQTWSCNAVAAGTAAYARFLASIADAGAVDAAEAFIRMQFDVGVTGAVANLTSTSFTSGVPVSVQSFLLTAPAS